MYVYNEFNKLKLLHCSLIIGYIPMGAALRKLYLLIVIVLLHTQKFF